MSICSRNSTVTTLSSGNWTSNTGISTNGSQQDLAAGGLRPQCHRDAMKFRVIRGTNSLCTEQTVSLHKIVKYTNRLMFTLQELATDRQSCAVDGEWDVVDGLINKVKWFQKDLARSTESADQMAVLLNTYDKYRAAYYTMRNRINDGAKRYQRHLRFPSQRTNPTATSSGTCVGGLASGGEPAAVSGSESSYILVTVRRDKIPDGGTGKKLDKSPAVLDVTQGKPTKDWSGWLSWIRDCCCFCLPCKCLEDLWYGGVKPSRIPRTGKRR